MERTMRNGHTDTTSRDDSELRAGARAQAEISFLRERLRAAGLPDRAMAAAEIELARMERLSAASPEYSLSRSYFDWILALPWRHVSEDRLDAALFRKLLDSGHYGLEYVKEQIARHLAVMSLRPDGPAPVLCFAGPVGTGKTSLAHSIARILGRPLVRVPMRGAADEADIIGQRRAFADAMPGKIMRALRTAGVANPVIVLEQIDQLGTGGRGDAAAALFEALDNKTRSTFTDHYLDVPFDLTRVLFVVTAQLFERVPEAVVSCLEPIYLPGYVQEEKFLIARDHLLPREREKCGLLSDQFDLDEWALRELTRRFPREAGVDGLRSELGRMARRAALMIADRRSVSMPVSKDTLAEWIEPGAVTEPAQRSPEVGVAHALAITPAGAAVSPVEVTRVSGRSELMLTGPSSEDLRELVQTAVTILRARAKRFDIKAEALDATHLHIHISDELANSDLESVGMATVAALISAFTGKPIRADMGITGGISLRGRLRPVDAVIDKVLAARRMELEHVIVPAECAGELEHLPAYVRDALKIHPVQTVDEALDLALLQIIVPKPEETSAIEMFQSKPPGPKNAGSS